MPRSTHSKQTPRLKQIQEKLKMIDAEIARRKRKRPLDKISGGAMTAADIASTISESPHTTLSPMRSLSGGPSKPKRSGPSMLDTCLKMIRKVTKLSNFKDFVQPVDTKTFGLHDYHTIVKRPMDLTKILNKLEKQKSGEIIYETPYDMMVDLRQIWNNCALYNGFESNFTKAAMKCHFKVEEEFSKMVTSYETNGYTKRLFNIISFYMKHQDNTYFLAPVDPVRLNIPDYFEKIPEPMDLGTIANRIHKYTKFQDFVHDVMLVFDNAISYNPPDNLVHLRAHRLKDLMARQLPKNLPPLWEQAAPFEPSTLDWGESSGSKNETEFVPPKKRRKLQHDPMDSTTTAVQQPTAVPHMNGNTQLPSMNGHNSLPNPSQQPSTYPMPDISQSATAEHSEDVAMGDREESDERSLEDIRDSMTQEQFDDYLTRRLLTNDLHQLRTLSSLSMAQKEELEKGIMLLEPHYVEQVVAMLRSILPDAQDEEMELDIDQISPSTQVALYVYMIEALQKQQQERHELEQAETRGSTAQQQPLEESPPPQPTSVTAPNPFAAQPAAAIADPIPSAYVEELFNPSPDVETTSVPLQQEPPTATPPAQPQESHQETSSLPPQQPPMDDTTQPMVDTPSTVTEGAAETGIEGELIDERSMATQNNIIANEADTDVKMTDKNSDEPQPLFGMESGSGSASNTPPPPPETTQIAEQPSQPQPADQQPTIEDAAATPVETPIVEAAITEEEKPAEEAPVEFTGGEVPTLPDSFEQESSHNSAHSAHEVAPTQPESTEAPTHIDQDINTAVPTDAPTLPVMPEEHINASVPTDEPITNAPVDNTLDTVLNAALSEHGDEPMVEPMDDLSGHIMEPVISSSIPGIPDMAPTSRLTFGAPSVASPVETTDDIVPTIDATADDESMPPPLEDNLPNTEPMTTEASTEEHSTVATPTTDTQQPPSMDDDTTPLACDLFTV